ncbi:MAG TPA: FtsX-like permease family protein [Bacteroidales bacterium]|nr:FtsX-like permease family protein [Bacteroidales bacterium]
MFWYYLKIALRNIRTNKKFSTINIAGFAFAISICMAISLFLVKEYSYDQYHGNAERIVRLIDTKDNSSMIDYRVKEILQKNYSEIVNACLVLRSNHPIEVKCRELGYYLNDIMSVDNNFFEVFTISFLSGQPLSPFINNNSAVITETTATTLFGKESPLGKEIFIWGNIPVTITGLIRDFPENSSITAGILVNAENDKFKFYQSIGDSRDLSTYRWLFQIYLHLNINVNTDLLAAKINEHSELLEPYNEQVGFLKLKDIYLHDSTTGSETKQGNPGLLNLLAGIALIILTLAVINYINLTIAQQNKRNKDTGIKKTFGANRSNILYQFLIESVIVIFAAFGLGILLIWFLIPFYQSVFNATTEISLLFQFPCIIILPVSILVIGIISGSGPAIVLSGISPVRILTGSSISPGKKNYLRNSLTIFQFTISIVLIFCVMIVQRQIKYVKNKNPGFNEEQLLRLDVPNVRENDIQKAMVLLDEFRKSPYIKSQSVSSGVPGEIRMFMSSNMENNSKNMSVPCLMVDTSFLETFGLKVIRGRNLGPGDIDKVCMINEAAYKHFDFENLENKRFNNFQEGGFEIIGVVNDFHYSSLHKTIGPVCIMFTSKSRPTSINIRFAANGVGPGMEIVKNLWQDLLPGYPMKYQFYDEWFDSMYRSEEYFARTISLFAILAIVISCIGILGLSIFSSERRTKEIGIRRVAGAKSSEILILLNKEFIKWVVVAFVIATPVAWFAMHKWLQNFAYRTELSWWIFAFAGLSAVLIALLTVSWQSLMAAARNPVEALRYE